MNQEITEYFRNLKLPKGLKIEINQDQIVIQTSNTNSFSVMIYLVMFAILVGVGFALDNLVVFLILSSPLVFLAVAEFFSKSRILLKKEQIHVINGMKKNVFKVQDILKISYDGSQKTHNSFYPGANQVATSSVCMRVSLESGERLELLKNANNQKFVFKCLKFYVDNFKNE